MDPRQPKPDSTKPEKTTGGQAAREKELLERIRQLEEMNSALQDKLDMIWSVLEPDYELPPDPDAEEADDDGGDSGALVQIQGLK